MNRGRTRALFFFFFRSCVSSCGPNLLPLASIVPHGPSAPSPSPQPVHNQISTFTSPPLFLVDSTVPQLLCSTTTTIKELKTRWNVPDNKLAHHTVVVMTFLFDDYFLPHKKCCHLGHLRIRKNVIRWREEDETDGWICLQSGRTLIWWLLEAGRMHKVYTGRMHKVYTAPPV